MTEHFYANRFAARTADFVFFYGLVYFCNLFHVQFACKNNDIGELSIESQCLDVADVQLCAQMYFLPYLPTVEHYSNITRYDSADACFMCGIEDATHQF